MPPNWNRTQQDYYDYHSDEYTGERIGRSRAFARKASILARSLRQESLNAILEVGAGSGLVTTQLAPQLAGVQYTALDLSVAMAAAGKSHAPGRHPTWTVADAGAVPFTAECFDAIVAVDLVHHLSAPVACMREWRRITRPGGQLRLLETNPYHPINLQFIGVEHEQRLFMNSRANLVKWAQDAGWRDVRLLPTAAFTPSGPRPLWSILNAIDRLALYAPAAHWLSLLWLLTAKR